jgi:hypothetical protein
MQPDCLTDPVDPKMKLFDREHILEGEWQDQRRFHIIGSKNIQWGNVLEQ